MKKALIASTALVLSAGVAAADVTISGYGRTAVVYQENNGDENDAQISSRVRLNVHDTTSTDQGVDFGARLRLQWDQGDESLDRVREQDELAAEEKHAEQHPHHHDHPRPICDTRSAHPTSAGLDDLAGRVPDADRPQPHPR